MSHHVQHAEQVRPRTQSRTPYPRTAPARAKAAQSPEHVSRWVLAVALLAAAAIFWTLAADAFASM